MTQSAQDPGAPILARHDREPEDRHRTGGRRASRFGGSRVGVQLVARMMEIGKRALGFASAVAAFYAVTLLGGTGAVAQQTGGPSVFVEVLGSAIPGFADSRQLAGFLADHMDEAVPSWHFVGSPEGAARQPNRVEWKFKTLKTVGGGSARNGLPQSADSHAYVSAEVKLYLNNVYLTTTLCQATVTHGTMDTEFAAVVEKVTKRFAAAWGSGIF